MSAGTIKVYDHNHDIIEERYYYTWDGAKHIVNKLLDHYVDKGKFIHFCPNVKISDEEQREFGRNISSVYGNLKTYGYSIE